MIHNLITPGLTFDHASHRYALDDHPLPGVTEIIKAANLVDYSHSDQLAIERGNAVHAACHYLEEGDLDRSSLDPRIVGYVSAYERFTRECVAGSLISEALLAHKTLRYAGTLDRICWLHDGGMVIPDWKTGGENPAFEIQLAAYRMLIEDNIGALGLRPCEIPSKWMIVRLHDDGRYSVQGQKLSPARARNLFIAALSTYSFRREFKLLPEEAA